MKTIRIGTRGSELALWQANHAAGLIGREKTEIKIIKTQGDIIQNVSFDKMEGKAFFTKEIEDALIRNEIDIAVHSLKDLPTDEQNGLTVAAVLKRDDPSDILLIRNQCYNKDNFLNLYDKAIIGTSSVRRSAQIQNAMSSLKVLPLRGNVPTRIQRLREGKFDAIIIARAGINRLNIDLDNLGDLKSLTLPCSFFLPAPSQGALALQIREADHNLKEYLMQYNDADTYTAITAERSFLKYFGGGCHIPLGAFAYVDEGTIHLSGSITSADGKNSLRSNVAGDKPELLGKQLAEILKAKGADKLL
jgi:hydroxymethylbilane synthase